MTTTRELRKYQNEGANIVTIDGDIPVVYEPFRKGDTKPWVRADRQAEERYDVSARYSAGKLTAVTPDGGGPWVVARLLQL